MQRVHLNGLLLIDCPASALNNSGDKIADARTDNTSATKFIRTKEGKYAYVSAQAFRYWIRDCLEDSQKSPIEREKKIAYTQADPITYAEDDLFGYMRAEANDNKSSKDKKETLTRLSPLKVSTLVSISSLSSITQDFGVMARHEGDPVPYEHEFYRTTLKGLISLDMTMLGRFYHISKTGYKHLGEEGKKKAQEKGLIAYDSDKAYEISKEERIKRIESLMNSLKNLTGGAKQAVHYTDVNPKFIMLAVIKNGNNLFSNAVSSDDKGLPKINFHAIKEVLEVFKDDIVSKIYIGLPQGYLDNQRDELKKVLDDSKREYLIGHPKNIIESFIEELKLDNNWLV